MDTLQAIWEWVLWAGSWTVWIAGSFFLLAIAGAIIEEIVVKRKKRKQHPVPLSVSPGRDGQQHEEPRHDAVEPDPDDSLDLDAFLDLDAEPTRPQPQVDPDPEWAKLLGLSRPFTRERLDAAYREQARKTHPDRGGSADAFRAVQWAFEQGLRYV